MKTIVVKFNDSYGTGNKDYHYAVDDDIIVSRGDTVVVHNGTEYRLTTVIDVVNGITNKVKKTVVNILTKESFDEYTSRNQELKSKIDLYTRLEQLLAQESENNKYRLLAQSNTEAASILKQLGIS